jgi:hypothetical protein
MQWQLGQAHLTWDDDINLASYCGIRMRSGQKKIGLNSPGQAD